MRFNIILKDGEIGSPDLRHRMLESDLQSRKGMIASAMNHAAVLAMGRGEKVVNIPPSEWPVRVSHADDLPPGKWRAPKAKAKAKVVKVAKAKAKVVKVAKVKVVKAKVVKEDA